VTSKLARFETSGLQHAGTIARLYLTHIIDLNELKQRLTTEWAKLDHVVIAAAIRQQRR